GTVDGHMTEGGSHGGAGRASRGKDNACPKSRPRWNPCATRVSYQQVELTAAGGQIAVQHDNRACSSCSCDGLEPGCRRRAVDDQGPDAVIGGHFDGEGSGRDVYHSGTGTEGGQVAPRFSAQHQVERPGVLVSARQAAAGEYCLGPAQRPADRVERAYVEEAVDNADTCTTRYRQLDFEWDSPLPQRTLVEGEMQSCACR